MLLFIIIPASFAPRFVNFNTSHVTVYRRHTGNDHPVSEFQYISCYCLSIRITIPFYSTKISIHLMLLFIGFALYESGNTMVFQYISCYCLSLYQHSWMCLHQDFNTSHVTVYQGYHKAGKEVWDISIHLMLLFITPGQASAIRLIYISIHLMLLFINNETAQVAQEILFQYISCYCLSPSGCTTLVAVAPFQYISCYCLSVIRIAIAGADGYFNTSHVTVYRRYREPASNIVTDFNTSHVTVYHIRSIVCTTLYHISIHLMLLFIISACIYSSLQIHFNTSHVTVYPKRKTGQPYRADISIHLMLLFIWQEWISYSIIDWHFNTSHVTVYHCKYYPDLHYLSDFNTSHVTVYPGGWCYVDLKAWFQYISCYCLSVKVGRMQEDVRYFNTSHVTVYRKKLQRFY